MDKHRSKFPIMVVMFSLLLGSSAFGFAVFGKIGEKYARLNGEHGPLGVPRSDEANAPFGGRFNDFAAGSIFWHPKIGEAFAVWGAIGEKYRQVGGPVFGYPITDELPTIDRVGRFNHFRGMQFPDPKPESSIFWTPTTCAHEVHGAIRAAWAKQGFERGELGYPTSDELPIGNARVSNFERGSIIFKSTGLDIESPSTVLGGTSELSKGQIQASLNGRLGQADLVGRGITLHDFNLQIGRASFRLVTPTDFEARINDNRLFTKATIPDVHVLGLHIGVPGVIPDPAVEVHFDVILRGRIVTPPRPPCPAPRPSPHVEGLTTIVSSATTKPRNITGDLTTTFIHFFERDSVRQGIEHAFDDNLRHKITDALNRLMH